MMTWHIFLALQTIFCIFCALLPSTEEYNLISSHLFLPLYSTRTYSRSSYSTGFRLHLLSDFFFSFLLSSDSAIKESGISPKILKGRANTDRSEYLKVNIMGFKGKSQSLFSLSYQNAGSPRGLHRHPRLS